MEWTDNIPNMEAATIVKVPFWGEKWVKAQKIKKVDVGYLNNNQVRKW